MSYQDLLESVALFQGFHSTELAQLAQHAVVCRHAAGELIFQQGDPGTTLYIIISGQVEVYLTASALQATPIVLQQMHRGDYFGELSLFDNKPRSACARALQDVELLGITQVQLTEHLTRHPGAALVLLAALADRLRATDTLLTRCVSKNVDAELDKHMSWSDRLADQVATLNGSWSFIIILLVLTTVWMVGNAIPLFGSLLDPYPYVFFNLLLAILVALQGPLIVMSQNRKASLDRARAEADYHVNLKNEVNIELLLAEIRQLRRQLND